MTHKATISVDHLFSIAAAVLLSMTSCTIDRYEPPSGSARKSWPELRRTGIIEVVNGRERVFAYISYIHLQR